MPRKKFDHDLHLDLPEMTAILSPAHIWKRIAAFALDIIILNLVVVSFFKKIFLDILGKGASYSAINSWFTANPTAAIGISLMFFLLGLFALTYFTLMNYLAGQTIGQALLNLQVIVVTEKQKRMIKPELPGFWRSVLRSLFVLPVLPFYLLWLIDPVYLIFSRSRQRFTEALSKTVVVEKIIPYNY